MHERRYVANFHVMHVVGVNANLFAILQNRSQLIVAVWIARRDRLDLEQADIRANARHVGVGIKRRNAFAANGHDNISPLAARKAGELLQLFFVAEVDAVALNPRIGLILAAMHAAKTKLDVIVVGRGNPVEQADHRQIVTILAQSDIVVGYLLRQKHQVGLIVGQLFATREVGEGCAVNRLDCAARRTVATRVDADGVPLAVEVDVALIPPGERDLDAGRGQVARVAVEPPPHNDVVLLKVLGQIVGRRVDIGGIHAAVEQHDDSVPDRVGHGIEQQGGIFVQPRQFFVVWELINGGDWVGSNLSPNSRAEGRVKVLPGRSARFVVDNQPARVAILPVVPLVNHGDDVDVLTAL